MTSGRFSEQQLRTRSRITTISLMFSLSLILVLTMAMDLTGEWMTPYALGMTVLWLTLGLHSVLAILWDAYLPQGTNMKNMKVLSGILVVVAVLQAIYVGRMMWLGKFLEDGRLDSVWASLILLIVFSSALLVGAWKYTRKQQ